MPFPEIIRVIYEKNPLDEVICQLRFPPILKIDANVPADFQEAIRNDFPKYSEKKEINVDVPTGIKEEIPPEVLVRILQSSDAKTNYEFLTDDESWKVNLTRTFIALSTKKYLHWEEFIQKFNAPLKALNDIYSPMKYTRVGLRYINIIHRSKLGLTDVDWAKLIQPQVLGILGSDEIGNNVNSFESKYEILLSDSESFVRMRSKLVKPKDNSELCYYIDNDFVNEKSTNIKDVLTKLDFLRKRGSRFFRWCIKEELHQAMEPKEL